VTILEGSAAGRTLTLTQTQKQTQVLIGRVGVGDSEASSSAALLEVPDPEVSTQHALLWLDHEALVWRVQDLGSLNGTALNGRAIGRPNRLRGKPFPIADGDLIALGQHRVVRLSVSIGSAPTAAVVRSPLASLDPPSLPASPIAALSAAGLRLECHVWAAAGSKAQGHPMEDAHSWECPLAGFDGVGVFCVFDGHGGARAAQRAASLLPAEIARSLRELGGLDSPQGPRAALRQAFLRTDTRLNCVYEGCAATAVVVWRLHNSGPLYVQAANVGDCSAVLVGVLAGEEAAGENEAVTTLTEEHKVSNPRERARLRTHGVDVRGDRLYGLALSRALGDRFLKEHGSGLTADPYVGERLVAPAGASLVVATDGLWDVAGPELCAAEASAAPTRTSKAVATALAQRARADKSGDDLTVLVARLEPLRGARAQSAPSFGGALDREAVATAVLNSPPATPK